MIADKILNFIDGEYVATDKWYENRNPINNKVIGMVAEAGEKEVDAAVKAAKAALKGPWGSMSLQKRIELLEALVVEINNRFDDFLEAECADTGKPKSMASHVDIPRGAANFKVFADMVKNVPTEFFEMTTPDGGKAINYGYRRPVGVVGVICPWNLPLLLMTWKVGPALACGNTVVVKPSEDTPRTAALLGEVMNKVGIPKGVYNVVNGFGANSAGAFLTAHPDVDALTFTGETRTGEVIMKAAANGSRPVSLEMGGKNAAIVFADCDFDKAIEGTLRSVFLNCGQVCLGTERVYVERPIFDKFVAALKAGAEGMKIGVPDDPAANFGPLVSKKHQEKVLSYYKVAVEEGATVVTGGGVPQMPGELADGCWVQPTIWTGLPETARVIKEEIFGPCCHIAPFDTEEEVLEKANDNKYGLACAIWTQDVSRAHRVAQKMEVGISWVNSWFLRDLRTPFGGSKQSGIGREGGVHSLEFYTDLKNVCIKL
ncbi:MULTISPECIES: 2-hydroxymuconic semialdehyde dehydrogenase [Thauera]|jgi:aminomuconate-semialdehyde/2-hydroxymuconate-6-semialdehyde dehydrogenase|uniref:2-hydroxymuconic semialdehyde dehydrogenase n=2 Tax=Thauera aminoaromatica TaxID=164330 RepID=C4KBB4_THASP|nr:MULTISPECIES: 2-hydroxymuconic semialdehyde dehydrogenase [Thauera]TMW77962.1 2-hydroxymuconic semialdehyde dehydrogenase [Thauera sp. UPWRP]ACR01690.1 2-hydroxymuconic semialdehyde dehydrogenase [Thauera aminoaromatica]ENO88810.1 2-hydroxymuconic semialdehyde dehydrogenase [Thauera aminoaromatica S2]KIN88517.1 2-hydroxymuconic semialdehyde dehydrogenase [Thauera sp. SWB20]MBP6131201.1 2-hydroxymuconic semialdehyde dehydrogenase [Thauera sp.]